MKLIDFMHIEKLFPAVYFWWDLIPDAVKYWFSLTAVKAICFLLQFKNRLNNFSFNYVHYSWKDLKSCIKRDSPSKFSAHNERKRFGVEEMLDCVGYLLLRYPRSLCRFFFRAKEEIFEDVRTTYKNNINNYYYNDHQLLCRLMSAWFDNRCLFSSMSHSSSTSPVLRCWQKVSQSTNKRVVASSILEWPLLRMFTGIPSLSPHSPLIFSPCFPCIQLNSLPSIWTACSNISECLEQATAFVELVLILQITGMEMDKSLEKGGGGGGISF